MNPSHQRLNVREVVRLAFFFTLIASTLYFVFQLPRLTAPLTAAYLIYLIINPAIPTLMKFGLGKSWAIAILFSGLIFFSIYPIVKIVPTISKEAQNFQYYIPKIESYINKQYKNVRIQVREKTGFEVGDKYVNQGLGYARNTTTKFLLNLPKYLASAVEWIFLVPLFLFFMLKDGAGLKRLVLKMTPNSIFERFYYLSHQFNKQLGDYIFAKFVEAFIVGLIITTGLLLMDVRFALLLGLLAGITNIIPYVGPIFGTIPGLILASIEYGAGAQFGGVFLLYLIANTIDIALVFPILVSKIVNLHPIMVVVSVILGSQYFGVLGMVISIPCAAALKLIFNEVYAEIYSHR